MLVRGADSPQIGVVWGFFEAYIKWANYVKWDYSTSRQQIGWVTIKMFLEHHRFHRLMYIPLSTVHSATSFTCYLILPLLINHIWIAIFLYKQWKTLQQHHCYIASNAIQCSTKGLLLRTVNWCMTDWHFLPSEPPDHMLFGVQICSVWPLEVILLCLVLLKIEWTSSRSESEHSSLSLCFG